MNDDDLISLIAERITLDEPGISPAIVEHVLHAVHATTPLDLRRMITACDWDLRQDVGGMVRNFNHATGRLTGAFAVRFPKQ